MTAKREKDYAKNKNVAGLGIIPTTSNNTKNINFVTSTQGSVTSSQENLKRTNKPLMEKRRRARINQSLAILKALILESTKANAKNADGQTKHTKLEKADILELTVRHFQRHRNLDDTAVNKYRAGYTDCAREVARYLATPEPPPLPSIPSLADPGSKARLLRHLDQCIAEIDIEICPHSTFADSPSSSCYEVNCAKKTHDDNSMDYNSQDSNPLDFSKNNREGVDSRSNQPITSTSDVSSVQVVQDENNNRGTELRQSSPLLVANVEDIITANQIPTTSNLRDISTPVNHQLVDSTLDPRTKNCATPAPSEFRQIKPEPNGVLVLPPHYVQLAAALGLNTQSMLDPVTTRNDFERLIELSRVQQQQQQQQQHHLPHPVPHQQQLVQQIPQQHPQPHTQQIPQQHPQQIGPQHPQLEQLQALHSQQLQHQIVQNQQPQPQVIKIEPQLKPPSEKLLSSPISDEPMQNMPPTECVDTTGTLSISTGVRQENDNSASRMEVDVIDVENDTTSPVNVKHCYPDGMVITEHKYMEPINGLHGKQLKSSSISPNESISYTDISEQNQNNQNFINLQRPIAKQGDDMWRPW